MDGITTSEGVGGALGESNVLDLALPTDKVSMNFSTTCI